MRRLPTHLRSGVAPALLGTALLAAALLVPPPAGAAETYPGAHGRLRVETVADGLELPWSLAFLPDGRMLVAEQFKGLRLVRRDGALGPRIDGVPELYAVNQGGLLDLALHPDYPDPPLLFFAFAEIGLGGTGTAVARAELDLDAHALRDLEVIFRQQPKSVGDRHFGARLAFGPDGKLFVTLGDRAQPHRAQDASIHRGQVIRIAPDGSIPDDNPFVGRPDHRPEIWSIGHRNPQGAAIHPRTGTLWIHEHGPIGGDELNVVEPGRNYGWPVIHYGEANSGGKHGAGTHEPGMRQPIRYWDPSIAPSGMTFYTGELFPAWRGDLLLGALGFRMLVRLELDGRKVVHEEHLLRGLGLRIRDVVQGPDGAIYLTNDSRRGRILRVTPADGARRARRPR